MRVLIRVEGDAEGHGLMPWLLEDPAAQDAVFSPGAGAPGEMGTGEVVQAVIQNTAALGGLVVAVAAWWDARARRAESPLRVAIERDGVSVTVTGGDPAEVDRVVRALTRSAGSADGNVQGTGS